MPRKPKDNPVFTQAITYDYVWYVRVMAIKKTYKSLTSNLKRAMGVSDPDGLMFVPALIEQEYGECFVTKKGKLVTYPKKYLMHTDKRVRLAALSWMQGKSVWNTPILFDMDHQQHMVDAIEWFDKHNQFSGLVDLSQTIKYGNKMVRDAHKALTNGS